MGNPCLALEPQKAGISGHAHQRPAIRGLMNKVRFYLPFPGLYGRSGLEEQSRHKDDGVLSLLL